MEIYADILFLINFFMDSFIFWITIKLLKKNIPFYKFILGTFITALVYCIYVFNAIENPFIQFICPPLIISIGIFIILSPKNLKDYIIDFFIVHISAFLVGGVGMALFYYINMSPYLGVMIGYTLKNFSITLLLFTTSVTFIFIKFLTSFLQNKALKKQSFCDVKFFYNNMSVSIKTLIDTGNSLKDSTSGDHVIVAEFESIKKILPPSLKLAFYEKKEKDIEYILKISTEENIYNRIRLIPFKSLGAENSILIGFRPDKIIINDNGSETEHKNIILGISSFKLSNTSEFQGLISPEVLA